MSNFSEIKVLVGFSGGVDSAVSAYLLKKKGYKVTGCFMRNWDSFTNNDYFGNPNINSIKCPQESDFDDAVRAAEILGIKLLRVDFVKEYWDYVFTYFLNEYKKGRTPNPDVLCNKYIKFDSFLKFAKKNGFNMIAMGHYAKKIKIKNKYFLSKPKDKDKDQTYFLSQLNEEQIASCLFPLGRITKKKVRLIANKLKLNVANKKDSTGICFIGERNFKKFLNNYIPPKKGNIIDIKNNRIVGKHDGAYYYTIGQRKGLGIGGIKGEKSFGWIVVKKDVKKNIVYVSKNDENNYDLLSNRIIISNLNLIYPIKVNSTIKSKFRYRQKDYFSIIKKINKDFIELFVPDKVKAIAIGQIAVFYNNKDIMIGSGTIIEIYLDKKRLS